MKRYLWAAVILVLVLALAGWDSGRTVKYRLYIGLNDQDTYQQVKSTEEAQELVAEIALKYVEGSPHHRPGVLQIISDRTLRTA